MTFSESQSVFLGVNMQAGGGVTLRYPLVSDNFARRLAVYVADKKGTNVTAVYRFPASRWTELSFRAVDLAGNSASCIVGFFVQQRLEAIGFHGRLHAASAVNPLDFKAAMRNILPSIAQVLPPRAKHDKNIFRL